MSKLRKTNPYNNYNLLLHKQDPLFKTWILTKFTNSLFKKGKKKKIEKIILQVLKKLKQISLYKTNPLFYLIYCIEVLKMNYLIKTYKFGVKVFLVPIKIHPRKQYQNAIRLFVKSINSRTGVSLEKKIFDEIKDTLNQKNTYAIKYIRELKKIIKQNRHLMRFKLKR